MGGCVLTQPGVTTARKHLQDVLQSARHYIPQILQLVTPQRPQTSSPTLHLTGTTAASDKDLGKCIGAGAGDEGLRRVEGDIVDGLIVLLPVRRDLLHARPVVQHPQAHRAVVACRGQRANRSRVMNSFKV